MLEPAEVKWKRCGDSIDISYSHTQSSAQKPLVFIYGKDPRTRWQRIKDWFTNKSVPIYVDPENKNWGFHE